MNRKTILNRPLDIFRKAMLFLLLCILIASCSKEDVITEETGITGTPHFTWDIAVELEKRRNKNGFIGRTLTLKIRFADFTTKTKSRTDLMPFVGAERLAAAGLELLRAIEVPAAGVRLLGLSVSGDGGSAAAAREETLFAELEKNEA